MLRMRGRPLSFGDGVTAFAYQVLVDRQVIVFSGGACHSQPFGCRPFPAWLAARKALAAAALVAIDKGRSAVRLG